MRSRAERIESNCQAGVDDRPLAGIERRLAEVRDALRALTPAKSLVGLDETILGPADQVDRTTTSTQDPAALEQLDGAIVGLRGILAHVAFNDALATLFDAVRSLGTKVDHIANSEVFVNLDQRIATIADDLHARHQQTRQDTRYLEQVVLGLANKLEQLSLARTDPGAVALLEDHIAKLVEKLDASDARLGLLDAIKHGLVDLLTQLARRMPDDGDSAALIAPEVDILKRDVQRNQDSIEAVHGTLRLVVTRLATIESCLRAQPQPKAQIIPALPPIPAAPPLPPAMSEAAAAGLHDNPSPIPERERRPIDPSLPLDHPLEPSTTARERTGNSLKDRIAASEASLGPAKPPIIPNPGSTSNIIVAARRAAQTSSAEVAARSAIVDKRDGKLGTRMSSLLIGTSVALLVLGSPYFGVNFSSPSPDTEATAPSEPTQSELRVTPPNTTEQATTPPTTPTGRRSAVLPGAGSVPSAPPFGTVLPNEATRRNTDATPGHVPESAASFADRMTTGTVRLPRGGVATMPRSVSTPIAPPAPARVIADQLPAAVGSPTLRAAAAKGDPAVEYEIALRFLEGRGVQQDLTAAVEWFEGAAKQGLVPAQFRLGGLYEKGIGVKKNPENARRLYLAAAEAGNAQAMHNLAVQYAEGIDGKPDYPAATKWFRKAADHGVANSQYNLGVLYARGIGVETNLPDAYKWFTLAAREGDLNAAKKRDDVGSRLDASSLSAAQAAAQSWTAEQQPETSLQVRVPVGGWDASTALPAAPKRGVGPKVETSLPVRPAQ